MRRSFIGARGLVQAFGFVSMAWLTAGCSALPTSDPYDTRPIPQGARFQDKCTFLGEISCRMMSLLSSDANYERRPECIAFVEPNGTKIEQCGSVPGSTPRP